MKEFIILSEASELVKKSTKTIRRLIAKEEKENPGSPNIKRTSMKFGEQIEVSRSWLLIKLFLEKEPVKEASKKEVEKFMTKDIENMVVNIARNFSIYGKDLNQKVNEGRSHLVSKISQRENTGNKKAWVKAVLSRFFIDQQRKEGKEIISYTPTKTFKEEAIYRQDLERKDIYLKPEKKEEKIPEDEQERLQEINEAQKISAYGQKGLRVDENDEEDKSTGDSLLDGEGLFHSNKKIILEEMKKRFKQEKDISDFQVDYFFLTEKKGLKKEKAHAVLKEHYGNFESLMEKMQELIEERGRITILKKKYNKRGRRFEQCMIVVSPIVWDAERKLEESRLIENMKEINKTLRLEKNELIYALVLLERDFPALTRTLIKIIEGKPYREIFGPKTGEVAKVAREMLKELFGFDIKKGNPFPHNKEANIEEVKKRRVVFYQIAEEDKGK